MRSCARETGCACAPKRSEYIAERVIFAAPTFLAPYIVEGAPPAHGFVYSPWLTANLTIERPPEETAWDNVIYDSPTLGYVDATHMSLRSRDRTVGVDVLLGAGRSTARRHARDAARKGLDLLARSDPARSGARASRYSRTRFPHRRDAHRPRHGAAGAGISGLGGAAPVRRSQRARSFTPIPT